ncbi:MAG: hypothetical protein ACMUIU_14180 [bacterium]
MINQYKRLDVFRCTHESHHSFGDMVSVYHVLKEKGCYPHGCVYFKWKCKKLDHKLPCPKSYEHVGKRCTSCANYYDEKIVKHPRLLLTQNDYRLFLDELRDFEIWLNSKKGKESSCAGTVSSVKPRFVLNRHYNRTSLSFKGFLLTFKEGFIGLIDFKDTFFALLSPSQQGRLRLSEGDRLEFRATLRLDRGRIILGRVRGIEIEEKGDAEPWTTIEARKALFLGKMSDHQYEKCIQCPYGSLVDIMETSTSQNKGSGNKRRKLLCLKGISKPKDCIVQASKDLRLAESLAEDYCKSGEIY